MSCNQAFEVDLAGYLAEPRAPRFDAFRAHYPRCEVCSAELRAWTELDAQLGASRHPEPEVLASYAALSEAERGVVDRHAAGCASCREELRALDAFDPTLVAAPAAAPVTRVPPQRAHSVRKERAGWVAALARILWHPAFAYGVVLLLVVPVLWRTQGPGRFPDATSVTSLDAVSELEVDASLAARGESAVRPHDLAKRSLESVAGEGLASAPAAEPSAQAMQAPGPQEKVETVARRRVATPQPAEPPQLADAPTRAQREASASLAPRADSETFALREAAPSADVAVAESVVRQTQPHTGSEFSQQASNVEERERETLTEFDSADAAAPPAAEVLLKAATRSFAPSAVEPTLLPGVELARAPAQVPVLVAIDPGAARSVGWVLRDARDHEVLRGGTEVSAEQPLVRVSLPRERLAVGRYRLEVRDGALPPAVYLLPVF